MAWCVHMSMSATALSACKVSFYNYIIKLNAAKTAAIVQAELLTITLLQKVMFRIEPDLVSIVVQFAVEKKGAGRQEK